MPSHNIRQLDVTPATGAAPAIPSIPEPTAVPGTTGPGDDQLTTDMTIVFAILFGAVFIYVLITQIMIMLRDRAASRRRNQWRPRLNRQAFYNRFTADLESGEQPTSYSRANLVAGPAAHTGSARPRFCASNGSGRGDKILPPPYSPVALPGPAVLANHTQTTSNHVSWIVVESIELTNYHTRTGANRDEAAGGQGTEAQGNRAATSRRTWWPLPPLGIF